MAYSASIVKAVTKGIEETTMKNIVPILLAVLALLLASLACSVGTEMGLDNLRMAFDNDGKNPTTVFSPDDVFYAVADLRNATAGTVAKAKWIAADIPNVESGDVIYEQEINDFTDENFSGTIYFQLSNDSGWPAGEYKVEVYLNETLVQSTEFSVR